MDRLFFPALVVDFDGTLRYSKSGEFINGPEEVACYEGVFEKLWDYKDHGYLLLGLSNQGGVAHGYKTVDDLAAEIARMKEICEDRGYRWPLDAWHACLFKEDGSVPKFAARSLTRKPFYGALAIMAEKLRREDDLYVQWDSSLMVGDREEDRRCAANAQIHFLWADEWRDLTRPQARKMVESGEARPTVESAQ